MIDSPQILRPPTGRAIAATVALGANALVLLGCAVFALWTLGVLATDGVTRQVADLWDGLAIVLAAEMVLMLLAGAATVIVWLWAARENALRLDDFPSDFARPWVIFGWFVPIANLFVPCRIVKQVWQASTPGGERAWPVNLWWTFWLAYLIVDRLAGAAPVETVDQLRSALVFMTATCLLGVAAAALLAFVIWRITGFQRVQAEKWSGALTPAYPPIQPV